MHKDNLFVLQFLAKELQVNTSYSINFSGVIEAVNLDRMEVDAILKELAQDGYIEYGAFNGQNNGNILLTLNGTRAARNDR